MPRSASAGGALGVLICAAFIHESWWLGGAVVLAFLAAMRGSTINTDFVHTALRPALVTGGHALVLAELGFGDDGCTVYAQRLSLTSWRGVGRAQRVLGYAMRDLYRLGFLPLAALCQPHQIALARPERADAGYFGLLEHCLREGREQGELRIASLSNEAFVALFARDGAPSAKDSADRGQLSAEEAEPQHHAHQSRQTASPYEEPKRSERSNDPVASAPQQWCAGLPFQGEAPLGPVERWYLRQERATLQRDATLWGLHALMGLMSIVGLLLMMGNLLLGPLALLSLVGVFLWAPWSNSAFVAWRKLRLAERLANELAGERCQRFAGVVTPEATLHDDEYAKLVAAGLLVPDLGRVQEIMVGPQSKLLLSAGGVAPTKPIALHVGAVAQTPAAFDSSLPPGVDVSLPPGFVAKRRWLSASERAELETHVRRLRPVRPWLVVYAVAAVLIYSWIGEELAGWVIAGHLVILACMAGVSYRRWRTQVMLERELELGWLLIVNDASGEHRSEILALSGAPWSSAAVAAPWRRRRDL